MSGDTPDICSLARRHFGIAGRKAPGVPPAYSPADVEALRKIQTPEPQSYFFGNGRKREAELTEQISQIEREISKLEGLKAHLELERREEERKRLGLPREPGDGWA